MAGAVAVMLVAELTVNAAAGVEPKVTPVAHARFVPAMVTWVPPCCEPTAGLTDVTDGAGAAL